MSLRDFAAKAAAWTPRALREAMRAGRITADAAALLHKPAVRCRDFPDLDHRDCCVEAARHSPRRAAEIAIRFRYVRLLHLIMQVSSVECFSVENVKFLASEDAAAPRLLFALERRYDRGARRMKARFRNPRKILGDIAKQGDVELFRSALLQFWDCMRIIEKSTAGECTYEYYPGSDILPVICSIVRHDQVALLRQLINMFSDKIFYKHLCLLMRIAASYGSARAFAELKGYTGTFAINEYRPLVLREVFRRDSVSILEMIRLDKSDDIFRLFRYHRVNAETRPFPYACFRYAIAVGCPKPIDPVSICIEQGDCDAIAFLHENGFPFVPDPIQFMVQRRRTWGYGKNAEKLAGTLETLMGLGFRLTLETVVLAYDRTAGLFWHMLETVGPKRAALWAAVVLDSMPFCNMKPSHRAHMARQIVKVFSKRFPDDPRIPWLRDALGVAEDAP